MIMSISLLQKSVLFFSILLNGNGFVPAGAKGEIIVLSVALSVLRTHVTIHQLLIQHMGSLSCGKKHMLYLLQCIVGLSCAHCGLAKSDPLKQKGGW